MERNKLFSGGIIWIVCVSFLWVACSGPTSKEPSEKMETNKPGPQNYVVEISQMVFSPATLTVNKGDSVTFINRDAVNHDVTEENTELWSSSTLHPQEKYTLAIQLSANYYCTLHPVMKGKIVVR